MPENLPISAFGGIDVAPELGVAFARSEGGLVITSRNFDPYWRGRFTTGPLDPRGSNERARFIAWLIWAADNNMRVDIVHPRHRYPAAYTADTWPMGGNAGLVDVPDLRTLVLSGLPAGLILRRGDRLSVLQDGLVVHRWIANDLVVASTIAQAVEVTPRLPIGVLAPAAAVVLENPPLRCTIVPGSWSDSLAEEYGPTPVTFEVMEALR